MKPVPRHLYPFDGQRLDLDGLSMHYLDEGGGEPVVMVHGNPTWSFYYRNLISELSDSYRCIAPDHIGMGLSDKPSAQRYPYTLERRIEDLGRLLDHVEPQRPVNLVVHDWGGMIGLGWAVRHAARIKRLVILNTAAFPLPPGRGFHVPLRFTRTAVGGLMVRRFNAFSRAATHLCVTRRPLPRAVRRAYTAPYDSWDNRVATLRFVQDIPLRPSDPGYSIVESTGRALAKFQDTPTRIFWGEKDFIFDDAFLREWERRMPNARVTRFPDCGHYVLEDASDEIIGSVKRFFTE